MLKTQCLTSVFCCYADEQLMTVVNALGVGVFLLIVGYVHGVGLLDSVVSGTRH